MRGKGLKPPRVRRAVCVKLLLKDESAYQVNSGSVTHSPDWNWSQFGTFCYQEQWILSTRSRDVPDFFQGLVNK